MRNQAYVAVEKQNVILEKIAKGGGLQSIIETILFSVEELIPNTPCSIMRYDKKTESLKVVAGPSLPASYLKAVDGVKLSVLLESDGTATYRKKGIIVSNISSNLLWNQYRTVALAYGIQSSWSKPIISSKGELLGIFALYKRQPYKPNSEERNIVERFSYLASIAMEQQIADDRKRKYDLMSENMSDLIDIVDPQGIILYASPSNQSVLGFNPEEMVGRSAFEYMYSDDLDRTKESFIELIKSKTSQQVEVALVNRQGQAIPFEINGVPVFDEQGQVSEVVVVCRNITERKKADEKIRFIAYHDILTKLPNRLSFQEQLQEQFQLALQKHQQFAVLFLDIDNFKQTNDTLGHSLADRLLASFADRIKGVLPKKAIFARVSGDEFSIVLPNVEDEQEVITLADGIIEGLKQGFSVEGIDIKVTTSIGISQYPKNGEIPEILVKNADFAMYFAKKKGKNTYQFFSSEIEEYLVNRKLLEKELKIAIDQFQFMNYYQPIYDVEKGRIGGVEALIRWNHPKKGLVPPMDFIPLAEENGLILQIGEWVLEQACLQAKKWQENGFDDLILKVNLSVKQLEQVDFVEQVAHCLAKSKLDPSKLELEITESLFVNETETEEVFKSLKNLGVKLSIDDFGKGFSSLSYLTQFPVDVLKIDRSFITKMLNDKRSEGIVDTIINLGKVLELLVIAEGVETEEQFSTLINKDVDGIQGYYISKPLTVKMFEELYVKRTCQ
ncbi:bifunctional diguanylate cyclase/phosphodiesterase [Bacillus solitudinis]|uniref:bifunctional diguanylate cyclase/phosphodiesterase n=1 Tax=Bacillus solitudinis TaxID=2014074 RepID=UPI000C23338D|nr:EAL domain-containing protein [Bacillus solitudinis]